VPSNFVINVTKAAIAMNVSVSPPGGATVGTPVTVTVTFPNEPELSGTVNILSGGIAFPAPISGGVATLTSSSLAPGDALGVTFPGDGKYRATTVWTSYTITDVPAAAGPTSLYLIAPCRVLDTRDTPGFPIARGEARAVYVARRCGIPFGAKAVAVNLTVINPQSEGYLTLYPAASPMPQTSTVNYRRAKTRANNAVLPLSAGGMLKIYNSGPPAVEMVLDVTGYFQ
jgi:hypothetical protein